MFYKTETSYIIELLKCAVTDKMPTLPPEEINWETVFYFAVKHRICSTLYFGLQKLPMEVQKTVTHFDDYLLAYKKALVLDANRIYELENLCQDFEAKHIDYVLLKGSVTKYLYPDTSMRTMNDIDILYRGADFDTIVDLFSKNGYQMIKKEPKDITFFKPMNESTVEMQTQLVDQGYTVWYNYLEDIWDRLHACKETHEYKMTNEDFYIYHIIHMAKHFKNAGIGLIHILDAWIITNTYKDMDYKYINQEFEKLGLDVFERNLRLLIEQWFGDFIPDADTDVLGCDADQTFASDADTAVTLDLMGEYFFSGGAFGLRAQHEINAVVERNEQKFSWRQKIFPDKTTITNYYGETVQRHPYLLPFYWIRLNISRALRGRKTLKTQLNSINSISDDRIQKTQELMERCGM